MLPRMKITHSSVEFIYYKFCFLFLRGNIPTTSPPDERIKKVRICPTLVKKAQEFFFKNMRKILYSIILILENLANMYKYNFG